MPDKKSFWDTLLGNGKKILGSVVDSNPITSTIADMLGLDLSDEDSLNNAAFEILNDPQKRFEFEQKVLEHKQRVLELQAAEMNSARSMYKYENKQADSIAERVFKHNLIIVLLLVIIEIFSIKFLDPTLLTIIGNIVGFVINSLLNERSQVIGFYFGSSLGSKAKELINTQKRGSNEIKEFSNLMPNHGDK
jgi:hypothetical protein